MTRSRRNRDAENIRRLVRDNRTSEALCAVLLDYVSSARAAERAEWMGRVNAAERELQKVTETS